MCVKIQRRTIAFAFCIQLWHGDCGLKKKGKPSFLFIVFNFVSVVGLCFILAARLFGLEPISGGLNLLTWLLAHVCLCNSHHSKPIVLQDEQLFFSFFEPMRTYWVGSIPRFFLQVTLQYHFSVFLFMCFIKLYLACIKRVFI